MNTRERKEGKRDHIKEQTNGNKQMYKVTKINGYISKKDRNTETITGCP